ncbi:hypothetical protein V6N13_082048 [Hibiscus sabdariffa]
MAIHLPTQVTSLSPFLILVSSRHLVSCRQAHPPENLQFTEEESSAVVIEAATAEENSKNWLVGSVITVTPVDEDFVVRIFRSVWKVKNVSAISELRPNFFLIKHVSAEAKDMILKRRPWVVHNELFSIEPFNPAWRANEYFFTTMVVWIWVHKLPLQAMNSEMVLRLGVSVGKALGVDHWIEGGNMGDFLRVLVQDRKPHNPLRSRRTVEYFSTTTMLEALEGTTDAPPRATG